MRELHPSAARLSLDNICTWLVTAPPLAYEYPIRPNLLIIGPLAQTEATVASIVAWLEKPAVFWAPDVPMPARADGHAIVIRDIATLSAALQTAWLAWLNTQCRCRPHIIATSPIAVFPLVTQGMFLEDLYYRLNTVVLDLRTSGDTTESPVISTAAHASAES